MIITLYKNCILNNEYREVFFHSDRFEKTNVFKDYLDGLQKKIIDSDVPIYLTYGGKFTIPFDVIREYEIQTNPITAETLIKEYFDTNLAYNYMKIEQRESYPYYEQYYFIKSATLINEELVIEYEFDIWHNFMEHIRLRPSLLTNSRLLNYRNKSFNYHHLPLEYDGNNNIEINSLTESHSAKIICRLQLYKRGAEGNVTERQVYMCELHCASFNNNTEVALFDVNDICNSILIDSSAPLGSGILNSGFAKGQTGGTQEQFAYEISDFYIIPYDFDLPDSDVQLGDFSTSYLGNKIKAYKLNACYDSIGDVAKLIDGYSTTIPNDFKNIGVGIPSHIIDLDSNGSDIPVKIQFSIDNNAFRVFLNVQNKIEDITNNFVLELPISVETSESTELKRANRIFGTILSSGSMLSTLVGGSITKNFGSFSSLPSQFLNTAMANVEMYTSNKSISVRTSPSLLNCYYGLILFTINPDNEQEVIDAINNNGYVVNEYVTNEIFEPEEKTYDVIKFDNVNVYGDFSHDVRKSICDILNGGVKIWYTSNV